MTDKRKIVGWEMCLIETSLDGEKKLLKTQEIYTEPMAMKALDLACEFIGNLNVDNLEHWPKEAEYWLESAEKIENEKTP